MLDQVSARWPARARSQLEEAAQVYAEAAAIIQDVTAVTHFAAELTDRAADYLRWRNSAGRDIQPSVPSQHQLARLLDTLTETCTLLEQPDPRQITRLRRLYVGLIQLRQQIETGLSGEVVDVLVGSPGDAWKIEAMLTTVLPDGPTRMRLLAAAAEVESQRLRGVTFPSVSQPAPLPQPPTRDDWQWLVDQARLEVKLARLATFIAGESSANSTAEAAYEELDEVCCGLAEVVLGAATSSTTPSPSRSESLQAVAKIDSALASFHRNLPARINDLISSAKGRSDVSQRDLQMREYRALRALRCVDPRDVTALEGLDLKRRIVRAETYDHLAWLRQRQLAAREDSPAGDVEAWTVAAENYRRMAVSIRDQPPLTADLPAPLAIEAAADLSLISTEEDTVRVTLRNTSSRELRVWVLRHFDAEMLDVQTVATPGVGQVYDQSRWESDRGELRNAVSSVASHADAGFRFRLVSGIRFGIGCGSGSVPTRAGYAIADPGRIPTASRSGSFAGEPGSAGGQIGVDPDAGPASRNGASASSIDRQSGGGLRGWRWILLRAASDRGGDSQHQRSPAGGGRNPRQLDEETRRSVSAAISQSFHRLPFAASQPVASRADTGHSGLGHRAVRVGITARGSPAIRRSPASAGAVPTDGSADSGVHGQAGARRRSRGHPVPEEGAAPEPGGGDAGEDPAGDKPAGEGPAASDSPPGGDPTRPLPASILVVLRDRGTGRQTIQHVGLAVQRPRRYLLPARGIRPGTGTRRDLVLAAGSRPAAARRRDRPRQVRGRHPPRDPSQHDCQDQRSSAHGDAVCQDAGGQGPRGAVGPGRGRLSAGVCVRCSLLVCGVGYPGASPI